MTSDFGSDHAFVFISYAREDRNFVRRLANDLQRQGVRVWYDIQDIQPGENWRNAILNALNSSTALLYVASRHSIGNEWTSHEVELAGMEGLVVLPIIIDAAGTRLGGSLAERQWIDFRESYEEAISRLVRALPRATRQQAPSNYSPRQSSRGYAFISYSEEDSNFVDSVAAFLAGRGYGYWDFRTADRNYQAQFYLELEEVIQNAAVTLSVLTPSWKRSDWALKEYIYSLEVKVPVYLLRLEDMGPTLVIAGVPYIDFATDVKAGFDKLARALERSGVL